MNWVDTIPTALVTVAWLLGPGLAVGYLLGLELLASARRDQALPARRVHDRHAEQGGRRHSCEVSSRRLPRITAHHVRSMDSRSRVT
jgi:hypothetical protein